MTNVLDLDVLDAENVRRTVSTLDKLIALVGEAGASPATNTVQDRLKAIQTALATLHTDLATTLAGYVDGLEGLIGTSNTNLATLHTDLATTLAGLLADLKGYTDGLETLVTSSNTKLDTIHTDLGTTLAGLLGDLKGYTDQLEGYVDGLEGLVTSTNTKLDALTAKIPAQGQAARAASMPVTLADINSGEYETVAASASNQAMGATGAAGDYLMGVLVIPATTSPGAVQIKDGGGTAITVFTGGASSVSNLVPFMIPLGIYSTAGAWQITTGANVSAIGIGNFT